MVTYEVLAGRVLVGIPLAALAGIASVGEVPAGSTVPEEGRTPAAGIAEQVRCCSSPAQTLWMC